MATRPTKPAGVLQTCRSTEGQAKKCTRESAGPKPRPTSSPKCGADGWGGRLSDPSPPLGRAMP
eukprot:8397565-Alexandrium_andersonii.AAC.1